MAYGVVMAETGIELSGSSPPSARTFLRSEAETKMDATGKRVLVAEDNRVMSDVIRFNLQRTGVIVSVAHSGTHALELLQSRDFDALLSDYQMPGMNGEQLCRSVRTCGRNEQIPIVMVSAKGLELDKARLESELGLTRFLHKPFSARQMIDAVHDALATHTA